MNEISYFFCDFFVEISPKKKAPRTKLPKVAIAISDTSRPGNRCFGVLGARRREALLRPPEEARGQRASLWRRRRALKTDSPSAFLACRASAAPAPQPPLPVHQKCAPLRGGLDSGSHSAQQHTGACSSAVGRGPS
jgi:hypothetical protein